MTYHVSIQTCVSHFQCPAVASPYGAAGYSYGCIYPLHPWQLTCAVEGTLNDLAEVLSLQAPPIHSSAASPSIPDISTVKGTKKWLQFRCAYFAILASQHVHAAYSSSPSRGS